MPRKRSLKVTPNQRKIFEDFRESGEIPNNPRTLQRLVNALRNISLEREKALNDADVPSVSLGRLENSDFWKEYKDVKIPKNADAKQLNSAYLELKFQLTHLNYFLSAKSSTVSGATEINFKQDQALFGVDENNMPLGTLSKEDRMEVWKEYGRFKDLYKTQFQMFYKTSSIPGISAYHEYSMIQREIAKRVSEGKKINLYDLKEIYNEYADKVGIPFNERIVEFDGDSKSKDDMSDLNDGILTNDNTLRDNLTI